MDGLDAEGNFTWANTNDDNSLDVEGAEYRQDSRLVNVHQYFPALENNFSRAVSGRLGEVRQAVQAEKEENQAKTTPNDAIVSGQNEEDTVLAKPDWSDGPSLQDTSHDWQAEQERVKGSGDEGKDDETGVDEGLSHDARPAASDGLFATAVDEDTIEAARQRQNNIFTTDEWNETKTRTVCLSDIVYARAFEHYQRAMEYEMAGRWLEVITALTKAISLKDNEAAFFCLRGEAYIQLCDFQSAILNYKKACLLATNDTTIYRRLTFLFYFQGQCLFDQGLYAEALESFSRAAEMNPSNVGYHIRSISCLAALQRHGECLALVNKRLEVDHDNPDLYVMRARLHDMFRNTSLCYYDVKDALTLQPDHPEAGEILQRLEQTARSNKNQAVQLNIAGKHREALQKISIAIETNPSMADYHVLRGALHRRLNDFNAAIDDFLLALDKCDHDEDNPVYRDAQRQLLLTYNDFAVECFTKGFYEEALILLNKAIKGEKNEKGLYINRGDCFFKQGELGFALQDYMQAWELDPADTAVKARISVIHNEFGVNAYQEKNYMEAENKFTLALQYNPHVGQYYISRSRARYMMEKMTGARQDLVLGLLLDPTNEDILSILARLFPGKSVADVVNSPAADAAQAFLHSVGPATELSAPLQHSVPGPVDVADVSESEAGPLGRGAVWNPTGAAPPLAQCMEEAEFNQRLVREKRKVEVEVKDALISRPSLRHHGARIQPLPPAVPHQRYGGPLKSRLTHLVSAAVGHKRGAYNWRTFSLGIGLQDS